jgi:hypothetical protein
LLIVDYLVLDTTCGVYHMELREASNSNCPVL